MGFTAWAKKRKWVEVDPLEGLVKAVEKKGELVHPRRALAVADIAKLPDAALRRPEVDALLIWGGRARANSQRRFVPRCLNGLRRPASTA
jgi:hypothetical protein